nr:MAG TPA: Ellis van Creveld protein 2 like protein [Caudoviricetes sp.]
MKNNRGKIIYNNDHLKVTVRKTTRMEKITFLIGVVVVLLVWWLLAK